MALFSFRHSVKTFSEKRSCAKRAAMHGQTEAHLRYITRPQAARVVLRSRLSNMSDKELARNSEKDAEKRKGRVCERFILALPIEASFEQREILVRSYCEAITKGVAGYVAAIHDKHGNDVNNPHVHIVAFDTHIKGEGRGRPRSTLGMARKNAVEEAAALWVKVHNFKMREWGYGPSSTITRLSYADRGIAQIPQIHEGVASRKMAEKGWKSEIKKDWHRVDAGHSRAEANRLIREINILTKETEQDEARYDRLGNDHESDRGSRTGCREDDRASSGGPGRDKSPIALPWTTVASARKDAGCRPASQEPATTSSPPFVSNGAPCSAQVPPPLMHRRVRPWGSIRRVFHELVMWRDTLSARSRKADLGGHTSVGHTHVAQYASQHPKEKSRAAWSKMD